MTCCLQCDEYSLREYFAPFGDIMEVLIPRLENGKKRGFGIVQFASVTSAANALKQLNATVLLGMVPVILFGCS